MADYVDWSYYNSRFPKLTETDFNKYLYRAQTEMKLRCFKFKLDAILITDDYYENIQNCVCELINKLYDQDNVTSGNGLSSVSNDGYSESYVTYTDENKKQEIQSICNKWVKKLGVC